MMGQHVPSLLKWCICQMCHAPACVSSNAEEATISRGDLEQLALTTLSAVSENARGPQLCTSFFHLDEAQTFRVLETTARHLPHGEWFVVSVVPCLLNHCGVSISVAEWQDVLSYLHAHFCNEAECSSHGDSLSALGSCLRRAASSSLDGFEVGSTTSRSSTLDVGEGEGDVPVDSIASMPDSDVSQSDLDSRSLQSVASSNVPWFHQLSREDLLAKLHDRDAQLSLLRQELDRARAAKRSRSSDKENVLRGRLANKQNLCKKLGRMNAKQNATIASLQKAVKTLSSMVIERKGTRSKAGNPLNTDEIFCDRRWLTPNGTIQLAIKRNLTHCASEHIQLLIQQDISRWTVSRI